MQQNSDIKRKNLEQQYAQLKRENEELRQRLSGVEKGMGKVREVVTQLTEEQTRIMECVKAVSTFWNNPDTSDMSE